MNRVTGRVNYW